MKVKFKDAKNSKLCYLLDDFHGIVSVYEKTDVPEGICIHRISVTPKNRRKGLFKKAIPAIIEHIKTNFPNEAIYLLAMPIENSIPKENLVKTYGRFGFVSILVDVDCDVMVYAKSKEEQDCIEKIIKEFKNEKETSETKC